ncbi:DUF58 domain-containing protein [Humidisolicoccus flavus]|uniref:DUF58 domain-containing protein n=1 Tax=Humidisolicoccus flavus TaxID=3111414 RepID=UPI0032434C43
MAIHAHRRTFELLDGQYMSIHHGRSHDFDDLREYQAGDEVKDIDWKATARSPVPLVKRYIASRKHNVVIVADTGRNMAATAQSGEVKAYIAQMAIGVLSYIAVKHGDRVAMYAGNADHLGFTPEGGSEAHLERMLRILDDQTSLDAPLSNLQHVLEQVAKRVRGRALVIVVSDDLAYSKDLDTVIARLQAQHEVLWVSIGDADLMARDAKAPEVVGVADLASLPDFVRRSRSLMKAFDNGTVQRREHLEHELRGLGIASIRIPASDDVIPSLFKLLERHRRVRR